MILKLAMESFRVMIIFKRFILFTLVYLIQYIVFVHIGMTQEMKKDALSTWANENIEHDLDISQAFYYEDCSYLGIFGENKYKINIRFDSVWIRGVNIYVVEGKGYLKGKVSKFQGLINLEHIDIVTGQASQSEIIFLASGTYHFTEVEGGIFTGHFKKHFTYDVRSKIISNYVDMELGENEGFGGVWISPSSQKSYRCHFGFANYPSSLADDFDAGGEPNIDLKYKKYGWEEYFSKTGYAPYFSTDCEDDWWN